MQRVYQARFHRRQPQLPLAPLFKFFHPADFINSTGWDLRIHKAVHKGCKQVKSASAHIS